MSTQQLTYAFTNPQGKVRTIVLTGEDLPAVAVEMPAWYLGCFAADELIYVKGPVDVPDESGAANG